jgi:hypothetical protein
VTLTPVDNIVEVSLSEVGQSTDHELAQLFKRRKKTYRFANFADETNLSEPNAQLHERRQRSKATRDTD